MVDDQSRVDVIKHYRSGGSGDVEIEHRVVDAGEGYTVVESYQQLMTRRKWVLYSGVAISVLLFAIFGYVTGRVFLSIGAVVGVALVWKFYRDVLGDTDVPTVVVTDIEFTDAQDEFDIVGWDVEPDTRLRELFNRR